MPNNDFSPYKSPRVRMHEIDLELATRWWGDYSKDSFYRNARVEQTFDNYISDVFQKSKGLARTASTLSIRDIKEGEPGIQNTFIKKSPSVSALAPSHMLYHSDRVATRYIPSSKVYKTESDGWYGKSYGPQKWDALHRSLEPEVDRPQSRNPYAPYTQYYSNRLANAHKTPPSMQSYLRGSERYMSDHIRDRLSNWDKALPHIHSAYDATAPSHHKFNRHLMLGSKVFVSCPTGLPKYYSQNTHAHNMFKLSRKYINHFGSD